MSARGTRVTAQGLVISISAAVLLTMSAVPAAAWSENIYVAAYGVDQWQETKCNCVPASARFWIRYTRSDAAAPPQHELANYMAYPKDRNSFWDESGRPCTVAEGNPYWSTPHDAQGWAWAMYNYATTDHSKGYDDYIFNSRSTANWQIVWNLRATGRPVGVIAAGGRHAILAVGYQTDYNPWLPEASVIYGFRVWDPWFGRTGNIQIPDPYPPTGYEGGEYISLGTWNSVVFRPDTREGAYYMDRYVLVLQKSTATQPGQEGGTSYGEYIWSQHQGLQPLGVTQAQATGGRVNTSAAEAFTESTVAIVDPAYGSVEAAVDGGLRLYGLLEDAELGLSLTGYRVGARLRVSPLDATISAYDLVELWVGDQRRAVALVWDQGDGHVFGALVKTKPIVEGLLSSSGLASTLTANGLVGPARAVWSTETTDETSSPFYPFIMGTDPATGKADFVTATGRRTELELQPQ